MWCFTILQDFHMLWGTECWWPAMKIRTTPLWPWEQGKELLAEVMSDNGYVWQSKSSNWKQNGGWRFQMRHCSMPTPHSGQQLFARIAWDVRMAHYRREYHLRYRRQAPPLVWDRLKHRHRLERLPSLLIQKRVRRASHFRQCLHAQKHRFWLNGQCLNAPKNLKNNFSTVDQSVHPYLARTVNTWNFLATSKPRSFGCLSPHHGLCRHYAAEPSIKNMLATSLPSAHLRESVIEVLPQF